MIRDNELKRILQYCKGLGINVVFKTDHKSDAEAEWLTDGSQITIFKNANHSKVQLILALIHELGHHMDWVYKDRKIPIKLDNALGKEYNHTEHERSLIYKCEKDAAEYHTYLVKELQLKIPHWKILFERDLALEIYKFYYEKDRWPTTRERREMRKKFREKHYVSKNK